MIPRPTTSLRRLLELTTALRGGKRVGTEDEDQSPATRDREAHAIAPFRARKDVLDVDPDALSAVGECRAHAVDRERRVLARVTQERVEPISRERRTVN